MTPEIKGLFLGGGYSQRMGSDKALLRYGSTPELRRWQGIFASLGIPFHWSQRPEQHAADQFPDIPRLYDEAPGAGPLAAARTAHRADPWTAWLILACDWPLLASEDLARLVRARDPALQATAFVIDGFREPLCTIYEANFLRGLDPGETSLSRALGKAVAKEVEPIDRGHFLNANDEVSRRLAFQNLAHRSDR